MSGIYIHIPFCKKACYYCDFHFSTSVKNKTEIINALTEEIRLRKNYLPKENIQSIYFGGGTPSLLEKNELSILLNEIYKHFKLSEKCEITLEANPDDLSKQKILALKKAGINRLSVGVQSFFDDDLKFLNRAHTSKQALYSIKEAQEIGFTNITIDLIYGVPELTLQKWQSNIEQTLKLEVPHISAYALTVEPQTALHHFIKIGKNKAINEDAAVQHYKLLCNALYNAGFIHYEISNFAKPNFYSVHNTSYWQQKNYLGIGPSAHSFNGYSRQWNIKNNALYLKKIKEGEVFFEKEELSISTKFNEYILTGLRTIWGLEKKYLTENFGNFLPAFNKQKEEFVIKELIKESETHITLTEKGKLFADQIASDFFVV